MSKSFYTSIDLVKNELQNFRIQNLASAPSSPVVGQEYFDTVNAHAYVYNGSAWEQASGAGISSVTLTGNVTGTGTSSITTTIAAGVVTNAMLAGSIAASKLIGSDITTVGTITTGVWNGSAITSTYLPNLNNITLASADLSLNSHKITSLSDPTNAQDAATKHYVDTQGSSSVTLTGNVTGSGTGTVSTTIAAGVVTNAMLAGSIAASKLIGTDINTVGTITTGVWNGSAITSTYLPSLNNITLAGADLSLNSHKITSLSNPTNAQDAATKSYVDSISPSVTLTGNVTGTGSGSVSTTIAAGVVTNSMLAGSIAASKLVGTDITTVGTIGTGVWHGTPVDVLYGGTGATTAQNARVNLSGPITADTDGSTITFDMSASEWHTVTLGGNRTLAVTNVVVGQQFSLILKQDGTGSRTVTWFSGILWSGGTTPTLTTTASKSDVFTFKCISTGVYLGFFVGNNF